MCLSAAGLHQHRDVPLPGHRLLQLAAAGAEQLPPEAAERALGAPAPAASVRAPAVLPQLAQAAHWAAAFTGGLAAGRCCAVVMLGC